MYERTMKTPPLSMFDVSCVRQWCVSYMPKRGNSRSSLVSIVQTYSLAIFFSYLLGGHSLGTTARRIFREQKLAPFQSEQPQR